MSQRFLKTLSLAGVFALALQGCAQTPPAGTAAAPPSDTFGDALIADKPFANMGEAMMGGKKVTTYAYPLRTPPQCVQDAWVMTAGFGAIANGQDVELTGRCLDLKNPGIVYEYTCTAPAESAFTRAAVARLQKQMPDVDHPPATLVVPGQVVKELCTTNRPVKITHATIPTH